jgi:uroporphyrinogen-III synthase
MKILGEKNIRYHELPMVETVPGPDKDSLQQVLRSQQFSWTVITSPEAASVFAGAWEATSKPDVRIAVVGKGAHPVCGCTYLRVALVST